jgi:hypothetical protein
MKAFEHQQLSGCVDISLNMKTWISETVNTSKTACYAIWHNPALLLSN